MDKKETKLAELSGDAQPLLTHEDKAAAAEDSIRPPYTRLGNFRIFEDRISQIKERSKGDEYEEPVCQGGFFVSDTVKCPKTGSTSYLITALPPPGGHKIFRLEAAMLNNKKDWLPALAESGILFFKEGLAQTYLLQSAAECQRINQNKARKLVRRPGWFSDMKGYHTGKEAIFASDADRNQYWVEPEDGAPFAQKGLLLTRQSKTG